MTNETQLATPIEALTLAMGATLVCLMPAAVARAGIELPWVWTVAYAGHLVAAPLAVLAISWRWREKGRQLAVALGCLAFVAGLVSFFKLYGADLFPMTGARNVLRAVAYLDAGVWTGVVGGGAALAVTIKRSLMDDFDLLQFEQRDEGHSRWATMEEVGVLFPSDGKIVMGELYRPDIDPESRGVRFDSRNPKTWGQGGKALLCGFNMNFTSSSHMMMVAGSGAMKTVGLVVPVTLSFPGSMVVLDPAAEIAAMVSGERLRMGRRVMVLDPTQHVEKVVGFNVLEPLLDDRPDRQEWVTAFAKMLGRETHGDGGGGSSKFFDDSAQNLVAGLLMSVLTSSEYFMEGEADRQDGRHLGSLRALIAQSEKDLQAKLAEIIASTDIKFVTQLLSPFIGLAPQTFSSILAVAANNTAWLSMPGYNAMVTGLGGGGRFSTAELPGGELDVFLQVPGRSLQASPGIARVVLGSLMQAMEAAQGQHVRRTLFCIDEASLLGYMSGLIEARDRGRKFGMTLLLIFQTVEQVNDAYGQNGFQAWVESCSFVSFVSVSSQKTANELSERCGTTTIRKKNATHGTSVQFGPMSANAAGRQSESFSTGTRRLITADEILQEMRPDEQIVLMNGLSPIRLGRPLYFRRPEMLAKVGTPKFK